MLLDNQSRTPLPTDGYQPVPLDPQWSNPKARRLVRPRAPRKLLCTVLAYIGLQVHC